MMESAGTNTSVFLDLAQAALIFLPKTKFSEFSVPNQPHINTEFPHTSSRSLNEVATSIFQFYGLLPPKNYILWDLSKPIHVHTQLSSFQ